MRREGNSPRRAARRMVATCTPRCCAACSGLAHNACSVSGANAAWSAASLRSAFTRAARMGPRSMESSLDTSPFALRAWRLSEGL